MSISMRTQDKGGLIGKDDLLPWRSPNDVRFFREHIMDRILVMGRKTYEGMGDLSLPYRHVIMLTTQPDFCAKESAEVIYSIDELLSYSQAISEDIYISGGSRIFQELLPYTDRTWRTLIDGTFKDDTCIGSIDFSDFVPIEEYEGITDQENLYAHCFQKWEGVENRIVSKEE